LAEFFEKGYTGEPDFVEAFAWYTLAKPPLGSEPRIESALGGLRKKMTKGQITTAEKRIETYRKQFGFIDPSLLNKEDLRYGPNAPKPPQ
jgi:hypothetical protein